MLTQLLILINQGIRSKSELSKQMDVSLHLLEGMMMQLVQQGYLADLACMQSHCDGCAVKGGCFAGTSQHLWVLTAKGRRAVAEEAMLSQKSYPTPR